MKAAWPPRLLGLGDDVQGQGRLARGLGAVDLDDPAPREAADAEGQVERDGPGRDGLDVDRRALLAELHDRALAELLFDLGQGRLDGLRPSPLLLFGVFVFHGTSLVGRVLFHHGFELSFGSGRAAAPFLRPP